MKNNETLVEFVSEKYDFSHSVYIRFQGGLVEKLKNMCQNQQYIHLLLYKISQDCPSSKLLNFRDINTI